MWSILLFLGLGIFIGAKVDLSEKFKSYNAKLQHLGVVLLLFIMGASIGLNKSLLKNLKNIGFKSFTFAFFTSVASIIIVYSVSKFMLKEEEKS